MTDMQEDPTTAPLDINSAIQMARAIKSRGHANALDTVAYHLATTLEEVAFALLVMQNETGKCVFVSREKDVLGFTVRDVEAEARHEATKDFDEPGPDEHTVGDALGLRRES